MEIFNFSTNLLSEKNKCISISLTKTSSNGDTPWSNIFNTLVKLITIGFKGNTNRKVKCTKRISKVKYST